MIISINPEQDNEDKVNPIDNPESSKTFYELVKTIYGKLERREELEKKEKKLCPIIKSLEGKVVMDLGAGKDKSSDTYMALNDIGIKKYIGVEGDYSYANRLREEIGKIRNGQKNTAAYEIWHTDMATALKKEKLEYNLLNEEMKNLNIITLGTGDLVFPKNLNEEESDPYIEKVEERISESLGIGQRFISLDSIISLEHIMQRENIGSTDKIYLSECSGGYDAIIEYSIKAKTKTQIEDYEDFKTQTPQGQQLRLQKE